MLGDLELAQSLVKLPAYNSDLIDGSKLAAGAAMYGLVTYLLVMFLRTWARRLKTSRDVQSLIAATLTRYVVAAAIVSGIAGMLFYFILPFKPGLASFPHGVASLVFPAGFLTVVGAQSIRFLVRWKADLEFHE